MEVSPVEIELPLSLCTSSLSSSASPSVEMSFRSRSPSLGGETLFPNARITQDRLKKAGRKSMNGDFADFCQNSLYFKLSPAPGDAVLFWDYRPRSDIQNHSSFERSGSWEFSNATTEGTNDGGSLHGGCPVIEGEKWIATKWIRSTVFV